MQNKHYRIDARCNGCGACKKVCPVHCISRGNPYSINQIKCIRCGRCVSRCWRKYIKEETVQ
ncbi:4Fe-4S binding protein [Niameybacter massiliensis]|uniref:4Fe-4S binding protein n=1 Tax=Holtiella tumoricola TaxID=3018743 RepID=A0AA42DQE5_9FIRM|nr:MULTISPECIES: 4Fe-4S binding protein [Lachnospirales]MDA3733046.1 4Fe-4S binding protein [Holtiella tumoricola]